MEKMYLTNNKLVVNEASASASKKSPSVFVPSFSFGVTLLSIVGIGLLAYSMYERARQVGEA